MIRRALTTSALLLLALPVTAEVSVSRIADGTVELFFEAGTGGPWEQLRPEVAAEDLLNPHGDVAGDAWPALLTAQGTDRPSVVWSSGGQNREILFSWHDGLSWSAPENLSNASGNDELPAMVSDEGGNLFVTWTRAHNSRDLVLLTALSGDDAVQTAVYQLSERHDSARRPALEVHADGDVYVAYEEALNGNDPVTYLAIDRVIPTRDAEGWILSSGERPIDIARCQSFPTFAQPGEPLKPIVHAEDGHLWVDWLDGAGDLAWVERIDGAFTSPATVSLAALGGEQAAREHVRDEVLAP